MGHCVFFTSLSKLPYNLSVHICIRINVVSGFRIGTVNS